MPGLAAENQAFALSPEASEGLGGGGAQFAQADTGALSDVGAGPAATEAPQGLTLNEIVVTPDESALTVQPDVEGAGGVLVEVFQDRALGLPPLNRTLARRLIERTQIFKALQGIRGQKPVPLDQLETLLVRFSYLLCDFLDIQEIDINPLLASPEGLLALDARVLLAPAGQPKARLTIEPYPNQHTSAWTLKGWPPTCPVR